MWDDDVPEECLPCWIAQRNPQYTYIRVTSQGVLDELGTFRTQRGLRRARKVGRRIVTELLVRDEPDLGAGASEVVRTTKKNVMCLGELANKD